MVTKDDPPGWRLWKAMALTTAVLFCASLALAQVVALVATLKSFR